MPSVTFEVVAEGTGSIEFDDSVPGIPVENEINDENANGYDVVFEDGATGT